MANNWDLWIGHLHGTPWHLLYPQEIAPGEQQQCPQQHLLCEYGKMDISEIPAA